MSIENTYPVESKVRDVVKEAVGARGFSFTLDLLSEMFNDIAILAEAQGECPVEVTGAREWARLITTELAASEAADLETGDQNDDENDEVGQEEV